MIFIISSDQLEITKILLENDAKVDRKCYGKRTPLIYAVQNKRQDYIRILLEHKAKVNMRDRYGRSPLWHAVKYHKASIRILMEYGADINAKDVCGDTLALMAFANEGEDGVAELLVKQVHELSSKLMRKLKGRRSEETANHPVIFREIR